VEDNISSLSVFKMCKECNDRLDVDRDKVLRLTKQYKSLYLSTASWCRKELYFVRRYQALSF
jgi:hypothetical protein